MKCYIWVKNIQSSQSFQSINFCLNLILHIFFLLNCIYLYNILLKYLTLPILLPMALSAHRMRLYTWYKEFNHILHLFKIQDFQISFFYYIILLLIHLYLSFCTLCTIFFFKILFNFSKIIPCIQ